MAAKLAPSDLPYAYKVLEPIIVPMPDGVHLAGRLFLPEGAEGEPVPALLEMMPYRWRDFSRHRDDEMCPYFAGHGYAVLRVDTRGTGQSEGILEDEYLALEQDDAVAVLAWMREQVWCDGSLGMMGLSWSGFCALQTAARRPEGLKAIVAVGATDDRYNGDVHYKGGLVLLENPAWDATFLPLSLLPPGIDDSEGASKENWRDTWKARLEAREPWLPRWLSHQRRDAYWKHGSMAEDYARIECAVYTVGGFADGYIDPVFRYFEHLTAPKKALAGPWPHVMPNFGYPGPAIGFLQEMLKWWDHWLRGEDTGLMDEAPFRIFVKDYRPPSSFVDDFDGGWVESEKWPAPEVVEEALYLSSGGLTKEREALEDLEIPSDLRVGIDGGLWGAGGGPHDLPADQQREDAVSLCFDGPVLEEDLILTGMPEVNLTLCCDAPQGQIAVRLCDIAPDGSSLKLSYGVLNLTHRESHEMLAPLEPGRPFEVQIGLKALAHKVPAGHRLRLALSTSYWPLVWPSPRPFTLKVRAGTSRLLLPIWKGGEFIQIPFEPPLKMATHGYEALRQGKAERQVEVDDVSGEICVHRIADYGGMGLTELGITSDISRREAFAIQPTDPASARYQSEAEYFFQEGRREISLKTHYEVSSSETAYCYDVRLVVTLDGEVFHENAWQGEVARDLS